MMPEIRFRAATYDGSTYMFLDLGLKEPLSEAVRHAAMDYAGTKEGVRALAAHGESLDFRDAVHLIPQEACLKHGYLPIKDMPPAEQIDDSYTAVDAIACVLDQDTVLYIIQMMSGTMSNRDYRALVDALSPSGAGPEAARLRKEALGPGTMPASPCLRAAMIKRLADAWSGRTLPISAHRILLRWYMDNIDEDEWEDEERETCL